MLVVHVVIHLLEVPHVLVRQKCLVTCCQNLVQGGLVLPDMNKCVVIQGAVKQSIKTIVCQHN